MVDEVGHPRKQRTSSNEISLQKLTPDRFSSGKKNEGAYLEKRVVHSSPERRTGHCCRRTKRQMDLSLIVWSVKREWSRSEFHTMM